MTLEADLAEIRRLLAEAYQHYFANSDGYAKSSEGAISVHYPAYFWNSERAQESQEPSIEIYSYVLGPSRSHYFESSAQALDEVRRWHAEEMSTVYCGECLSTIDDRGECLCGVDPI